MATRGYFERKSDVATLKTNLRDAVTKKDSKLCHVTIKKTIQLMTLGIDVSSICPEIIMASATNDIVQKKLVYLYLCTCAESNEELALLAINTLVKDALTDNNPMIRGLALRSMLNMRIKSLLQYAKISLLHSLKDKNSYVRRNGVMACVKLFALAPEMFEEMELLSTLRNMIQDSDSQVSCNALVCVDEVKLKHGGIKLDKNTVKYLLERLPSYEEFSQCTVLQLIGKYQTNDEEEILEYLNYLDDRLKHANKAVVMSAVNLFLHFTKNIDWVKNDVYERIRTPILSILPSSSPEIVYPILSHVLVLLNLKPRLFHNDYKYFFIRNNDPSYNRQKKLEILSQVITEGNLQNIVDEIREYVHDSDMLISCKAIYSIGRIALENYFARDTCVNALIDILRLEVDYITAEVLQTLQELMIKYPSVSSCVLPEIENCWEQVQFHTVGKSAIIWIYGEYGQDIPAAPYHMEEIVDTISEEQSLSVKLNLLSGMMKLFFKRPPECQHTLGKLLKFCIDKETNMDIRDRALFYYRLIYSDIEQARAVFQSSGKSLPFQPIKLLQKNLFPNDDFHLKEFNTLSIVYDQPSSSFITQYSVVAEEAIVKNEDITSADSPINRSDVVVANLLGMNEEKDPLLEKGFIMEQNEFSFGWKNMAHSLKFEETFTVLPKYDEIVDVMKIVNIQLMASSRPHDSFWKFFLYAKMIKTGAIVLVELIVYHEENRMTVLSKSHDGNILDSFNHLYRNIFIGKWIALPR